MNHLIRTSSILVAALVFSTFARANSPQSVTKSAHRASEHGVQPNAICATCGGGGGGGGFGGGSGGTTTTTTKLNYQRIDPDHGTITTNFENGISLIIDYDHNQVRYSNVQGSANMNLDDVLLRVTDGNSAQAAALKSEIQAILSHRVYTGLIAQGTTRRHSISAAVAYSPMISGIRPEMKNGGVRVGIDVLPCDINWDCFSEPMGSYGGKYYAIGYWANPEDYNQTTMDFRYWQIWVNDHCSGLTTESLTSLMTGLTADATCYSTIVTAGKTWKQCATTATVYAINATTFQKNYNICHSSYPGPGKWGT